MQKKCRKCGTELPDNAKFCPHCGALIEREYAKTALGSAKTAAWKGYMAIITIIAVWCILGVSCYVL